MTDLTEKTTVEVSSIQEVVPNTEVVETPKTTPNFPQVVAYDIGTAVVSTLIVVGISYGVQSFGIWAAKKIREKEAARKAAIRERVAQEAEQEA